MLVRGSEEGSTQRISEKNSTSRKPNLPDTGAILKEREMQKEKEIRH